MESWSSPRYTSRFTIESFIRVRQLACRGKFRTIDFINRHLLSRPPPAFRPISGDGWTGDCISRSLDGLPSLKSDLHPSPLINHGVLIPQAQESDKYSAFLTISHTTCLSDLRHSLNSVQRLYPNLLLVLSNSFLTLW